MPRPTELTIKNEIQVVVLVLENHQGNILLTQRQQHQHLAGYWEFPGGKVETGETLETALSRECQEELKYTPVNPIKIQQLVHEYPEITVHLHVFYERNDQADIRPAEQQNMQWVAKKQLKTMQLPPANLAITEHILSANF